MKPAEPVTRTLHQAVTASGQRRLSSARLSRGAEREAVPAEVRRQPRGDLEVRRARAARSSQIVGISATGRRSRRALATSSMPISKPASDSMPTSRTNVGRVGLERVRRVAGADPGEPAAAISPAEPREQALEQRAADLLAAGHVAGRGRDDDAALDEAGEVVDLLGVVAAVGHRDDDDGRRGVVDAEADRVGRARPVRVEQAAQPAARAAAYSLRRPAAVRVGGVVEDDEDLARQRDRVEEPVEAPGRCARPRCRRG